MGSEAGLDGIIALCARGLAQPRVSGRHESRDSKWETRRTHFVPLALGVSNPSGSLLLPTGPSARRVGGTIYAPIPREAHCVAR